MTQKIPFAFAVMSVFAGLSMTATAQDSEQADGEQFDVEQLSRAPLAAPRNTSRLSIAPAGLVFASFDQNGDYRVDTGELAAGIEAAFAEADKNNNGTLSLVEVDAWRERALGSLDLLPGNTQFDRDFDARVTRAEFDDVLSRTAAALDKNRDTALEFSELLSKARPPTQNRRDRERIFPSITDRQRRQRRR